MSVDAEPDADAEADVLPESDTAFDADTEADLAHEVDADIDADTEADLAPDVLDATVDSASDSDASTKPPGPVHFEQPASGAQWQAGSTHVIRLVIDPELEVTFPGATWLAIAEVSVDGGAFVALDEGIAHAAGWERVIRWTVTAPTGSELRVRAQISARDPAGNPLEVGGLEVPSAVVRLAPSGLRACYAWSLVTSEAAFAPRDGAGALVKDGRMWLIGGWNPLDPEHFPEITVNEVWSSADGRTWRNDVPNAAPGMWERRHKAGYAVFDDALWILGGDLSTGHMQPDVWRSADGVAWTQVSAQTPWGERVLQMVWVHAGAMWVMGGQTLPQFGGPAESVIYNDVWRSTDGAQWQRVLEHAPWSPRGMMGGEAVHRGRMWILGGGTYDMPEVPARRYENDVWSSADGIAWRHDLVEAPWAARQYHEVAVWDGRMFVLEGYDGVGNRKDVWYSDDGVSWYELVDTPWAPRHASSIFVHDEALWVVTGNNLTSDVWRLDCAPPTLR